MAAVAPRIKLYTNHLCPWAHRAHIALHALGLPYDEVIIDLSKPREPWYLEVNPRGLVPAMEYNGSIITESAIVAQFLADTHPNSPSALVAASTATDGPLQRARIAFFVDAVQSKVWGQIFAAYKVAGDADALQTASDAIVANVVKEVEPLLKDANPFFGGSERLTMAEVLTGSFILRLLSASRHQLLATDLPAKLQDQAPSFWKWAQKVVATESVNYIWDEDHAYSMLKARLATLATK